MKIVLWLVVIAVAFAAFINIFIRLPRFGKVPTKESMKENPRFTEYRDGRFRNLNETPQLTGEKGMAGAIRDFLFIKVPDKRPIKPINAVKTDLRSLPAEGNFLVWFGHSSVLFSLDGKTVLVDPVFSTAASPVSFINRAFRGTDIYRPSDMPDTDLLIITHDHWDHLDYNTVKALRERVGRVVCPPGVGAHLKRWGYTDTQVTELDWGEDTAVGDMTVYSMPARHFSGRGPKPNQTLWASFLINSGGMKIFVSGDTGYGEHFKTIGERFGGVDVAIMENGQYNEDWKYIHMAPAETLQASKDVGARMVFPVHNSKYALARHAWHQPMQDLVEIHDPGDFTLATPMIGEVVDLSDTGRDYARWWTDEIVSSGN